MNSKEIGITSFVFLLSIAFLSFVCGAIVWPYIITTWAIYLGKTVVVAWWQGGLIGLVPGFGHMGVPLAILTWVLMLILL